MSHARQGWFALAMLATAAGSAFAQEKTLVIGSITTPQLNNALASGTGTGTPGVQVLQDLVKGVGGGHDLALVP